MKWFKSCLTVVIIGFFVMPSVQANDVDEIKVSTERMRFEKKVDYSRVNISNREIRRIPAFVEADVFRALQLLPSVTASNDLNAALIVR